MTTKALHQSSPWCERVLNFYSHFQETERWLSRFYYCREKWQYFHIIKGDKLISPYKGSLLHATQICNFYPWTGEKQCKKLQECTWFSVGRKGDSAPRAFPARSLLGWRVIFLRARGCGHLSACFLHMCSNCVWSSKRNYYLCSSVFMYQFWAGWTPAN